MTAVQGSITCLLPVRDGERDLPAWLESVAGFAHQVIALDDGSSDRTREILEGSRLVARTLVNPPRDTYEGWDDATNRQRLLDAAIDAGSEWVLFLDADERIDEDDGKALRAFAASDALPGCAYGIQMFRASGERVGADPTYVYRLFHAEPGQELSKETLHFNPIPASIPAALWIRTTIRARHLESPNRLEARRLKYAEADPENRWDPSRQVPLEPPARTVPWMPRPGAIPVLAVGAEGERATLASGEGSPLTCLVPVRNGDRDLPGWLNCVGVFADRVIALDDGSTDGTSEILAAHPLVAKVLRNERRDSYAGWNDAANRQRLLDAHLESDGGWAIFLDADESISADDGMALRQFVHGAADPSRAYGFRVYRMVDDEDHYDRARLWVYRLFKAEPGDAMPAEELHFVPVPTRVPRERWVRTTIRIKHLSSLTAERRESRLRKYEEADPDRRWQADYSGLVQAGAPPLRWAPRPEGMPVLADLPGAKAGSLDLAELAEDAPLLSAVVIARNNAGTIADTVRSVVAQECDASFEVIVAASGDDGTADVIRERFPQVIVVDVPEPGLPGAARNAGLEVARGEIVSFPGSHVELPPGSLQARMRAHEPGFSMVTGSIVNGRRSHSGWAGYFLDHSTALPERPSGELDAPPAHCSYTREALALVGGFPADVRAGEDTVVNRALWSLGHRAYRSQEIRLTHRNPCASPGRLVRHHFVRGRALGRILRSERSRRQALAFLRGYPKRRLRFMDENVERWGGELTPLYRRNRGLVFLGTWAATAGAAFEAITGGGTASASVPTPEGATGSSIRDLYRGGR